VASEEEKKPVFHAKAILLSKGQRAAAVVSGGVLVGAGGWAEIISGHDGVGTVAFVSAGALSALLGVVGRLPSRLSGKDYTVEFNEAVEQRAILKADAIVDKVVEELPREAREQLAELQPLAVTNPAVRGSVPGKAAASIAFEDYVLGMVHELIEQESRAHGTLSSGLSADSSAPTLRWDDHSILLIIRRFPAFEDYGAIEAVLSENPKCDFMLIVTEDSITLGTPQVIASPLMGHDYLVVHGFPTKKGLLDALRAVRRF
jgi:hypothetical protein